MGSLAEIYNFRLVGDSLATAGLPTEAEIRAVAESGFEAVINLAPDNNPPYWLPGEATLVQSLGLTYIHIPVNFAAPAEEDLLKFCDAMDAIATRKRFVHCAANKRVTAFLGLYRVIRQNWDREAAFDVMRGVWTPDATWQAFIDEMLAKHAPGPGTR